MLENMYYYDVPYFRDGIVIACVVGWGGCVVEDPNPVVYNSSWISTRTRSWCLCSWVIKIQCIYLLA